MELPDLAMTIGFLIVPPILIFGVVRSRTRAFAYSVVLLWLLMISGGQYHIAYTPNYNSIAPTISIVAGWIPASAYTGIWVAIAFIASPSAKPKIDGQTRAVDASKPEI